MRSRKRSPEAPDPSEDRRDATDPDGPQSHGELDAEAQRPTAEAEDEVAEAEARAQAAKARVERLRQAAEVVDADEDVSQDDETHPAKGTRKRLRRLPRPRRPRWLRRPSRKVVIVGAGIMLTSASICASGYIVWQHRTIMHNRQLTAEYAAAARQRVTTLMSIDPNHAKEDFQRILDASTGDLKSQLSVMSALMAKQAEESKVSSTVAVQAVAVQSVSDNSGVVIVAAKSDATGPDNAKHPALWRISVTLSRDGGQLKMSKVDFLQ